MLEPDSSRPREPLVVCTVEAPLMPHCEKSGPSGRDPRLGTGLYVSALCSPMPSHPKESAALAFRLGPREGPAGAHLPKESTQPKGPPGL